MTKKLLLADDSITIQKVIGIIFATEDYQLLMTDNGDDAYTKIQEEYPDLVIADVSMPGKNGFELCEALKSDPRFANTSVLLLPGTFDHFDEGKAQAVGADGWLTKPFESQALLDKVAQLLEADPIRLADGEPVEDVEVPLAADEDAETAKSGLDEEVLGLDEVDTPTDAGSVEEESSDDIWDAVSFEEDDLQEPADLNAAEGDEVSAEPESSTESAEQPVTEEPELTLAEPESEEPDFVAAEDTETLELADEFVDEVPMATDLSDAPLEIDTLELEEAAILTDETTDEAVFTAEEESPLEEELSAAPETGESFVDDSVFEEEETLEDIASVDEPAIVEEDLSFVEPLAENVMEEGEDILDLAEEDILAAEQVELEEEVSADLPSEPEVEVAADETAEEEVYVIDGETLDTEELQEQPLDEGLEPDMEPDFGIPVAETVFSEDAPEIGGQTEALAADAAAEEDEGFYFDADEQPPETVSGLASGTEVVDVGSGEAGIPAPSLAQVEQQLEQLSEDELKEVIAKVAGPTIEKLANEMLEQVVWEVVPDLAEAMISEEIRKIKQGAE